MSVNLYLLFFGILAFADIVLFHLGFFTLLLAKGETYKMQKGRRLLTISFILLLIILLLFLIFYFLKGKDIFVSSPDIFGEFPYPYHISPFPSGPEFVKLGKYYFPQPKLLSEGISFKGEAVYVVLCKKDAEYDILYISERLEGDVSKHSKYSCWTQNCDNPYFSYFSVPKDSYDKKKVILESLSRQFNPPCSESQGV